MQKKQFSKQCDNAEKTVHECRKTELVESAENIAYSLAESAENWAENRAREICRKLGRFYAKCRILNLDIIVDI